MPPNPSFLLLYFIFLFYLLPFSLLLPFFLSPLVLSLFTICITCYYITIFYITPIYITLIHITNFYIHLSILPFLIAPFPVLIFAFLTIFIYFPPYFLDFLAISYHEKLFYWLHCGWVKTYYFPNFWQLLAKEIIFYSAAQKVCQIASCWIR